MPPTKIILLSTILLFFCAIIAFAGGLGLGFGLSDAFKPTPTPHPPPPP
ncbi:MAG: hypothetical protein HYR94_09110, partial [Chloroflexi bacterium]|nr:hypothetical protein [Chloroflexota bacterium]